MEHIQVKNYTRFTNQQILQAHRCRNFGQVANLYAPNCYIEGEFIEGKIEEDGDVIVFERNEDEE